MQTPMKLAAVLATAVAVPAMAAPFYVEAFPNNTGSNAPLAGAGWQAHYGNDGLAFDPAGNPAVSSVVGSDGVPGYVFNNAQRFQQHIYWTEEQVSFGQVGDLVELSFASRNNINTEDLRFALRVDNDWFISQAVFNSPNSTNWFTHVLDVATADFFSLAFTPGDELQGGDMPLFVAATLPTTGTVTAVGVYDQKADNAVRFDTFTVTVPEPTSLTLLGLGGLGLLRRRH